MNVFLPYRDYSKSVSTLDSSRLNKQVLECGAILSAIKTGVGWVNHPITKAFKPYPDSLWLYLKAALEEAWKRGMKPAIPKEFLPPPDPNKKIKMPHWLNNEEIFKAYRSNLLRKGRADAVCKTLKEFYKARNFNNWLKQSGFPVKSGLSITDIISLEAIADAHKLKIGPNFYSQYGWNEPDDRPYIWPI